MTTDNPICFTISVVRSDGKVVAAMSIACPTPLDLRYAVEAAARDAERNAERNQQAEQIAKALCYRCQFCGEYTPHSRWGTTNRCPECGRKYDAILAQDEEE